MSEDGEVPGGDLADRVSYVYVVELLDHPKVNEEAIHDGIVEVMTKNGLVEGAHFVVTSGPPLDVLRNTRPPSEEITKGQKSFLQKLHGNLRTLLNRVQYVEHEIDEGVVEIAEMTMDVITQEFSEPVPIAKRRAGQLIDAAKEAIDDLQAELNHL